MQVWTPPADWKKAKPVSPQSGLVSLAEQKQLLEAKLKRASAAKQAQAPSRHLTHSSPLSSPHRMPGDPKATVKPDKDEVQSSEVVVSI